MNIPGAGGAMENPEMWDHAEEESERLLEELKKEVKADLKDIGVLRKEMHVTVPEKVIADRLEHNYEELMSDAIVPGFRKGRAPRQLVEKRFGAEVRESLTTAIVGQSFYAATENNELDVLGEPRFQIPADEGMRLVEIDEALQHLKLPEKGDFDYTCELELKPKFELPALDGIEVKSPDITVDDTMVEEQITRHRTNRGRYEPVSDAAQPDDQLIVDLVLRAGGQEVKRDTNVTIGVRPTALEGVPLTDFGEQMKGVKAGESRTVSCKLPPDFDRPDLRDKDGEFTIQVHEIKRLAPEPMEAFLAAYGFENEAEAREEVQSQLEAERDRMMERARRAQVEDYLIENTSLDLPEDFSARQTDRAVMRRVIDLQQRGVPMSEVERRIDELRTSAKADVARELKLSFILEKVADELEVHVTDEEVNTEIARMARMYNRRFDRIRDELHSRGQLDQLAEQIRHGKCIQQLLDKAKIVKEAADEKDSKAADSESK